MNVLKVGLALTAAMLTGCATSEGTVRKIVSSTKSGYIVGMATAGDFDAQVRQKKEMCAKLQLNDVRCNDDDFGYVPVLSEFGFAKGWTGGVGFVQKSMNIPNMETANCNTNFGRDKNCTYVRLQIVPNGIGTVTEIISRPGDNKCHWNGGGKAGGVVCENIFDYKKDNQAATSQ